MRIALVCPYDLDVPGGVQAHVRHLAAALDRAGDEVALVAPGRRPDPDGRAAAGEGTPSPSLGTARVGASRSVRFNASVAPITLQPAAAARTRRALREVRPDVVHVHEPMVPWVGMTAALTSEAPVVATFHAWSQRHRLYALARPVGWRLRARLAAAIAVSEPAASYHARALGWAQGDFRIVPNGVDVERFATATPFADVREDGPSLLFVGRLEPRKGLEPLVRAFIRLRADQRDLRLHVVGEGTELERCRRLLPPRLRSAVHFHGRVPSADIPRWFASCDLYVSPATGGESFGIVLLEAMAAGTPLVASAIPGYASVATDGVQGRLVAPADVAALTDAIAALLDDAALRTSMGEAGRRTAASYDWSHIAAHLRDVYARALAPPGGGS